MDIKKILEWAKTNKLASASIIIFTIIALFIILPIIFTIIDNRRYSSYDYGYSYDSSPAMMESSVNPSFSRSSSSFFDFLDQSTSTDKYTTTKTSELEIKEGSVEVKSEDAENDFETLKKFIEQENGYIENSNKYETKTLLSINTQVRIPTENFDELVEKAKNEFEIKDFTLTNYRIDIQRQLDEAEILQRSLTDYNTIREETMQIENGEERIRLLSRVTEEMQNLARQQKALERELGEKQKQSDLATINFRFEQKLNANIWPEDLGNRLNERLNLAIDDIAETGIGLLTNSFVLLIKVIEYIVYAIIIVVPISFTWNLWKKMKENKKDKLN